MVKRRKPKSKIEFFLILIKFVSSKKSLFSILFITTTFGLLYLMNSKNEAFVYEKFTLPKKSNNKSLDQDLKSINKKFKQEFDKVVRKFCDSVNLRLVNFSCLIQLNKLDKKYTQIKFELGDSYHPSHECLNRPKLNYHTFWNIENGGIWSAKSSKFSLRMLKLNVMSFLATQNLFCSKLLIWKLETFPTLYESEILNSFGYYIRNDVIELRTFDVNELCKASNLSHFVKSGICTVDGSAGMSFLFSISLSDFVRFFVLDLFGGIYFDGDIIFLKDMRPLADFNFAYRWSSIQAYNTAVLGIYLYNYINLFHDLTKINLKI